MSASEGIELGKEVRRRVPRSSQAGWKPGPGRTGPVEVLAEQDKSRVPVRYGRMLVADGSVLRAQLLSAMLAATAPRR